MTTLAPTISFSPKESISFSPKGQVSFDPGVQLQVQGEARIIEAWETRVKNNSMPIVVLLTGRRGQGKTLSAVWWAKMQMDRWKAHGIRRKVLSNIWIDFVEAQGPIAYDHDEKRDIMPCDPYLVDRLVNYYPKWAYDCLIILDEAQGYFSNRRSLTLINENFGQFLTQLRKRHCDIIMTTQFPQRIDTKAVLLQTDIFIICERFTSRREIVKQENGRYGWGRYIPGGAVHTRHYYFDFWGQWTGDFSRKEWPPQIGKEDVYPPPAALNLQRLFNRYTTDEIVAPIWAAQRKSILAQAWGEEETTPQVTEESTNEVSEAEEAFYTNLPKSPFPIKVQLIQAKKVFGGETTEDALVAMIEAHPDFEVYRDGTTIKARRKE